jgi:hypothetical protein
VKWLLHPTSTWKEWQGAVRHTYFLQNLSDEKGTELKFLAITNYNSWNEFVALPNGSFWWAFTPFGFSTNQTGSVAVFDSSGFKHIRAMPNFRKRMTKEDGRTLRFLTTNDWWNYQILEDRIVIDPISQ